MKRVFFAAAVTAFGACSEPRPPVAPEAMAELIVDAHMAEARSTQVPPEPGRAPGERNLDTLTSWYQAVFAHHGITQKQFSDAMSWYENHPDQLDSVYKRSVTLLELTLADTARK